MRPGRGVRVHRFPYRGVHSPGLRLTGGDGMWQRIKTRPATILTAPGLLTALVKRVRDEIAEFAPQLVVAHWLVPGALACGLAMAGSGRGRPPLVALGHGSDVHLLGRLPGGGGLLKALARRAIVAATSDTLAQRMQEIGGLPEVATVPLPVTSPGTESVRFWRPEGTLRLGCMGRLMADKGIERALDVLERLPDATLSIAGDGDARQRFEDAISQRELPARLLGAVVGQEKSRFFQELDALLFLPDPRPATAFGDNLPVSVLEALAHSVPVLATRVGALPSLLSQGGGVLVPAGPQAIAQTLASLTEASAARLSTQARQVARPYGPEAALGKLWQVAGGMLS